MKKPASLRRWRKNKSKYDLDFLIYQNELVVEAKEQVKRTEVATEIQTCSGHAITKTGFQLNSGIVENCYTDFATEAHANCIFFAKVPVFKVEVDLVTDAKTETYERGNYSVKEGITSA